MEMLRFILKLVFLVLILIQARKKEKKKAEKAHTVHKDNHCDVKTEGQILFSGPDDQNDGSCVLVSLVQFPNDLNTA